MRAGRRGSPPAHQHERVEGALEEGARAQLGQEVGQPHMQLHDPHEQRIEPLQQGAVHLQHGRHAAASGLCQAYPSEMHARQMDPTRMVQRT